MQNTKRKKVLIIGSGSKTGKVINKILVLETDNEIINVTTSNERQTGVKTYKADFTNRKEIKEIVLSEKPDYIINTAAITNVDLCETQRELAWTVNVKGVENLVQMCRLVDAHLIHFSTDYIFDGKNGPYLESDTPQPINYYGKTKLASENISLTGNIDTTIIRTNVLYGSSSIGNQDFVTWVINQLREKREIRVVNDQFSNPTLIEDIGWMVEKIIKRNIKGIYNVGGEDWINRYEFAQTIAQIFDLNKNLILPVTTASLQQPAQRPLKGGLITLKAKAELGIRFSTIKAGLQNLKRSILLEETKLSL